MYINRQKERVDVSDDALIGAKANTEITETGPAVNI